MIVEPLKDTASNAVRKLCHEDRPRVIEALMHYCVLIPEGRSEFEWFRLLSNTLETGDWPMEAVHDETPSFGTVIGIVPTHDSAVKETFTMLRRMRNGLVPLVDGDSAGDKKIVELCSSDDVPKYILQWQNGWAIEDAIGWVLKGSESDALEELKERIEADFANIEDLIAQFKVKTGRGRLKTNYLAYEDVISVIGSLSGCRAHATSLLDAITKACLGEYDGCQMITKDDHKSTGGCYVLRLSP